MLIFVVDLRPHFGLNSQSGPRSCGEGKVTSPRLQFVSHAGVNSGNVERLAAAIHKVTTA